MPVRTSARPIAIPTLAPTVVDGGNTNVLAMSPDGGTLYGGQAGEGSTQTKLRRSTNDGSTWTDIFTFSGAVVGFHLMDNGEVLVAVGHDTGSLWRSTGFAANPTTATWAKVLDSSGPSCFFRGEWTLTPWTSHGPIVIVNEYGLHTSASGTPAGAGKAWLSQDYGTTWTVVFDLTAMFPGVATLHLHASAYDPIWDRLWVTHGDAAGSGRTGIYYSDDRGATWTAVPGSVNTSSLTGQVTTIAIMDNCIVFLPDGVPAAITRITRRGYRKMGPLTAVHMLRGGTGGAGLGWGAYRNKAVPGSPLIMCSTNGAAPPSTAGTGAGSITVTYDGLRFVDLYRDTASAGSHQGFLAAVGPTQSGKVVAALKDARQANLSRFTAQLPGSVDPARAEQMIGGKATVANGGTIPHGLPGIPTRIGSPVPTVAGRQVAVTAVDATNLTISLTDSTGTAVAVAEPVYWTAGL